MTNEQMIQLQAKKAGYNAKAVAWGAAAVPAAATGGAFHLAADALNFVGDLFAGAASYASQQSELNSQAADAIDLLLSGQLSTEDLVAAAAAK